MTQIEVRIKDNIDSLSARAVNDALVGAVREYTRFGKDFLFEAVPKQEGTLAGHVGATYPYSGGGISFVIEGRVGIPEIWRSGFPDPVSSRYPIFVDKGSGIYGEYHTPIFAKRMHFMKLPPKDDLPIYHYKVKGQKPQEFMAKTYAAMYARIVSTNNLKRNLKWRLTAGKLV